MKLNRHVTAALVGVGIAAAAGSAESAISIEMFSANTYNPSFGSGSNVGEDFEQLGIDEGEAEFDGGLSTAVGSFEAIGGTGTGGTVGQIDDNDGVSVALRNGDVFGRENTTPDNGEWFLDSNDTFGIKWTANIGDTFFTRARFTLSDAADQGAWVTVSADGDTEAVNTADGGTGDGNIKLVDIRFSNPTDEAVIFIENFESQSLDANRINDGVGIDGVQISAVPLPASAFVLLTALGGLGLASAFQRRQT